jgi:hypothetical protein
MAAGFVSVVMSDRLSHKALDFYHKMVHWGLGMGRDMFGMQ